MCVMRSGKLVALRQAGAEGVHGGAAFNLRPVHRPSENSPTGPLFILLIRLLRFENITYAEKG